MRKMRLLGNLILKQETPENLKWIFIILLSLALIIIIGFYSYKFVNLYNTKKKTDKENSNLDLKEQVLYAIGNTFVGVYIIDLDTNETNVIKGSKEFLELLDKNNKDFFKTVKEYFSIFANQIYKTDFEKYLKKEYFIE